MADEEKTLKEEVLDKMAALVTAAFGLVAALAWNQFIQSLFIQLFGSYTELVPSLIYAVVVTVIAVIAAIAIARAVKKATKKTAK